MMVATPAKSPHLIDRLPKVRGRLVPEASLSNYTWFRTGGPAEVLFRPEDAEDLAGFLAAKPDDVPVTIIGVGSNVLVRDGGVKGVVIRLSGSFAAVSIDGDVLKAGAAALDVNVALNALEHSLAGLEFLSGIPGTIGGAVRMNAGAYGTEMKDVLVSVQAIDETGALREIPVAEMDLSYRHCGLPAAWVFTQAVMKGQAGDQKEIAERMGAIRAAREDTQPLRTRTGGSTFANPDGHKAWELIDQAGCRGLKIGAAQVSEKHCNFLLNTGGATAADIEALGEEVRRRVKENSGIELRWEIRRIGEVCS